MKEITVPKSLHDIYDIVFRFNPARRSQYKIDLTSYVITSKLYVVNQDESHWSYTLNGKTKLISELELFTFAGMQEEILELMAEGNSKSTQNLDLYKKVKKEK